MTSAVAETACRLQGDGSTPLQVCLQSHFNRGALCPQQREQVIAAIISGASLQGNIGPGEWCS